MMAADLDQAYTRWAHEELSDPTRPPHEKSIAQMLDHGSISFGRFAIESLSWEKRSVFTHNRRQEELEKFKAPGLVAQKKAYFEEYYKKIRALKALESESQQADDDGTDGGGNDDVHEQPVEDDGCESTLMSMKSMTDASSISCENCLYENPGKLEKNAGRVYLGCFNSEATSSFSDPMDKSIDEIELERNSSNVSQITTHMESDYVVPHFVQPKADYVDLENRSSNVSLITQIDTDPAVQFIDMSEANLDEAGAVDLDMEPHSGFHLNLKEDYLSIHDECVYGSMENESHNDVSEINVEDATMPTYSRDLCGVSQPMDEYHKVSEPCISDIAIEAKDMPHTSEEQTKMVTRPPQAKTKKSSTSQGSMNPETSNRPGSSRSLRGKLFTTSAGSMGLEPNNRPGTSRPLRGKISTTSAGSINLEPNNRPGTSRSLRGKTSTPSAGSISLEPNNRPGTSRSLRGNISTTSAGSINLEPSNRPGTSSSLRGKKSTTSAGSMDPEPNSRPRSSRSIRGFSSQQDSGSLARNKMDQEPIKRPASSRSCRGLRSQLESSTSTTNNRNQGPSIQPGFSRLPHGLGDAQETGALTRKYMNRESSNQPGSSRSLIGFSNKQVSGTLARNGMNQGPSVSNRPGSSRSLQGPGNRPSSSKSLQRPKNVPSQTGEEEGKIASSSNKNSMLGSDASSCTSSKEVHSKVTIPRPFSFATQKRASTERRITDTPQKLDHLGNSYNNNTPRRPVTPFQTRSFSSSLNTPKKTAAENGVKENTFENRQQGISRKTPSLESKISVNGHLRTPVHRSINLPASDIPHSICRLSTGVGSSARLDKKEETSAKTPSRKSKQNWKDGESVIRTPKPEINKAASSQTAHVALDKKTPRQEPKRWR